MNDLDRALRLQWAQVKPAACCWVCHAREDAPYYTVKDDWLPEVWRRTRRGYAGPVAICGECTAAGRKYQSRRAGT